MRRILTASMVLLLAACARAPREGPGPTPAPVRPSGSLIGMSADELTRRFGEPRLTVREGASTKLQWAGRGCVLDAYLYPPDGGRGPERVTHVDSRTPAGSDIDLNSCLGQLAR